MAADCYRSVTASTRVSATAVIAREPQTSVRPKRRLHLWIKIRPMIRFPVGFVAKFQFAKYVLSGHPGQRTSIIMMSEPSATFSPDHVARRKYAARN